MSIRNIFALILQSTGLLCAFAVNELLIANLVTSEFVRYNILLLVCSILSYALTYQVNMNFIKSGASINIFTAIQSLKEQFKSPATLSIFFVGMTYTFVVADITPLQFFVFINYCLFMFIYLIVIQHFKIKNRPLLFIFMESIARYLVLFVIIALIISYELKFSIVYLLTLGILLNILMAGRFTKIERPISYRKSESPLLLNIGILQLLLNHFDFILLSFLASTTEQVAAYKAVHLFSSVLSLGLLTCIHLQTLSLRSSIHNNNFSYASWSNRKRFLPVFVCVAGASTITFACFNTNYLNVTLLRIIQENFNIFIVLFLAQLVNCSFPLINVYYIFTNNEIFLNRVLLCCLILGSFSCLVFYHIFGIIGVSVSVLITYLVWNLTLYWRSMKC